METELLGNVFCFSQLVAEREQRQCLTEGLQEVANGMVSVQHWKKNIL